MKKFLAITAILAATSFSIPSAFAITAESGNNPIVSSGTPHLTDPDENTGAFFGGANSEPSSYFTSGGGGSATGSNTNTQSDDNMYSSGYSIRPDNYKNSVRSVPQQ